MLSRKWLLLGALASVAPAARADVKVHPIFSDNMVLQRGTEIVVWGTCDPGEKVSVALELSDTGTQVNAAVDEKGNWVAKIPARSASTDLLMKVKGNNSVVFKNVAVGDVWVCSGQSNMEWKLSQLNKEDKAKGTTADQGKQVAAKAANKNIRLFTVPNRTAFEPQFAFPVTATEGRWLECDEKSAFNFSAIGYFFGRDIESAKKVPIGLISADWGGTICEAWASKEALDAVPELKYFHADLAKKIAAADPKKADEEFKKATEAYTAAHAKWKEEADKAKADGKAPPAEPKKPAKAAMPGGPNQPSVLYNAMIAPITRYKIMGALWYQGESNAGRAAEYYTLFPTMIQDWRKQWGSEFPFFVVQLAPFRDNGPENTRYAEVRDAQFQASKKLKNVGYATLSDVGNETDIHPQAKEPVGRRLALAARAIAYEEDIVWSGPVKSGSIVGNVKTGNSARITFTHVGGGLVCKGEELTGFTACGEDQVFYPAKAVIDGKDTVRVTCDKFDIKNQIKAVRYGWVNFAKPDLNLFNKEGLPAVPFRTDDFPLTTAAKK